MPGAFEGDAHAYLMSVYKDPAQPVELRLGAAGKAIRYEKPALATIEQKGEIRYRVSDKPLTEDEWIAQHRVSGYGETARGDPGLNWTKPGFWANAATFLCG